MEKYRIVKCQFYVNGNDYFKRQKRVWFLWFNLSDTFTCISNPHFYSCMDDAETAMKNRRDYQEVVIKEYTFNKQMVEFKSFIGK